jgi:hypothetical protein
VLFSSFYLRKRYSISSSYILWTHVRIKNSKEFV